jgi:hypothetical protein
MRRIPRRKMNPKERAWLTRSVELSQKIFQYSQAIVARKYEGMTIVISKIVKSTTLISGLYYGDVFFVVDDNEYEGCFKEVYSVSFFDDGLISPGALAKDIAKDIFTEIEAIIERVFKANE